MRKTILFLLLLASVAFSQGTGTGFKGRGGGDGSGSDSVLVAGTNITLARNGNEITITASLSGGSGVWDNFSGFVKPTDAGDGIHMLDAAGNDSAIVVLHATNGDLTITCTGGDISFDNENLTTTGIITGGTGIFDLIDPSGAVDLDFGSVDVTDVTITTDGGTVVLDGNITSSGNIIATDSLEATYVKADSFKQQVTDTTYIINEVKIDSGITSVNFRVYADGSYSVDGGVTNLTAAEINQLNSTLMHVSTYDPAGYNAQLFPSSLYPDSATIHFQSAFQDSLLLDEQSGDNNGANLAYSPTDSSLSVSGNVTGKSFFGIGTTLTGIVPTTLTLTVAGTANEITSSAGAQDLSANRTWTLSLPSALTFTGKTVTGGTFNTPALTDQDASPSSVGQFIYDNTITGLDDGGLVWYDDDEIRRLVDIDASEGDFASGDDGKFVRFDWNGGAGGYTLAAPAGGGDMVAADWPDSLTANFKWRPDEATPATGDTFLVIVNGVLSKSDIGDISVSETGDMPRSEFPDSLEASIQWRPDEATPTTGDTIPVIVNGVLSKSDVGDLPFESSSSNDFDADRIAGDTSDDDDLDVAAGGTGVSTLTDGGVLLGNGTGDLVAMSVLADGEFIVGDGTTDPVPESGRTARISMGVDIPGLTEESSLVSGDSIRVWDSSADADRRASLGDIQDAIGIAIVPVEDKLAFWINGSDSLGNSNQIPYEAIANGDTLIYLDPNASGVVKKGLFSSGGAETNDLEGDGAANIADTEIPIGTGAGTVNYAAISGDGALANTGALTINSITVSDDESTDDAHEVVFTTDNSALESDGDLNYNPNSGTLAATQFSGGGANLTSVNGATITVADNENTNETNAVLFSPGGDVDGGTYTPESDGDLNYNPSTGTLAATVFSGAGTSLTGTAASLTVGNATVAAGVAANAIDNTAMADDAIGAAEMADADHGHGSWSGGALTVEDFALNAAADGGDQNIANVGTVNADAIEADGSSVAIGGASDDVHIRMDGSPDADDSWSGLSVTGLNGGETIAQWEIVYFDATAGEFLLADADAAGEFPAWGLAIAASTDGNPIEVVTRGIIRNDGWTWSAANVPLYLSDTPGALTETAPSTAGDAVQIVARTISDDEIILNVSGHWFIVPTP